MRRVRITAATLIAVCGGAVMAAPAMAGTEPPSAARFISTGGALKGSGEEQTFKLGPFDITCESAGVSGDAIPGESKTLTADLKFKKCSTLAHLGSNEIHIPTRFLGSTPFVVEYHANGFVEVGSEFEPAEEEAKLEGGSIELKVKTVKCYIEIPEQTIPVKAEKKPEGEYSEVSYSSEPFTKGKKEYTRLDIANAMKKIHFEFREGQCEKFKKTEEELTNGKYEGEVTAEVKGGSVEWTPGL